MQMSFDLKVKDASPLMSKYCMIKYKVKFMYQSNVVTQDQARLVCFAKTGKVVARLKHSFVLERLSLARQILKYIYCTNFFFCTLSSIIYVAQVGYYYIQTNLFVIHTGTHIGIGLFKGINGIGIFYTARMIDFTKRIILNPIFTQEVYQ